MADDETSGRCLQALLGRTTDGAARIRGVSNRADTPLLSCREVNVANEKLAF
jgi:hypothetical protein